MTNGAALTCEPAGGAPSMSCAGARVLVVSQAPVALTRMVEIALVDAASVVVVGTAEQLGGCEVIAERFGFAVCDQEGLTRDGLTATIGALRRAVPEGPTVVLQVYRLPPRELFRMMVADVDLLERSAVLKDPGRLAAQMHGTWPGNRHLRAFCGRHGLSPMETWAFLAACSGLAKCEACDEMGSSIRTLESHWSRIFGKTGIRCTEGVISSALRDVIGSMSAKMPDSPILSEGEARFSLPGRGMLSRGRGRSGTA
jgi:DNA-binding NarL/FixJ family response regulator